MDVRWNMGPDVIVCEQARHHDKMEDGHGQVIDVLISVLRFYAVCIVVAVHQIFNLTKYCSLRAASIE